MGGNGTNEGVAMNTIQYITINSTGNSSDFGDLIVKGTPHGALSNGTDERGVVSRCTTGDVMHYITINSTGNSTEFGDLPVAVNGTGGADTFD